MAEGKAGSFEGKAGKNEKNWFFNFQIMFVKMLTVFCY